VNKERPAVAPLQPLRLRPFLLSAVVCALLSWAGTHIPDNIPWLPANFPGLALGWVLFVLARELDLPSRLPRPASLLALMALSVAGWRAAIDLGYSYGAPLPFTLAGTSGGLTMGLGLLLIWRIPRHAAGFALLLTLAGALGGAAFGAIEWIWPRMPETLWILTLFGVWQCLFMSGLWLALRLANAPQTLPSHEKR
jgi:hypothetical protein